MSQSAHFVASCLLINCKYLHRDDTKERLLKRVCVLFCLLLSKNGYDGDEKLQFPAERQRRRRHSIK